MQISLFSFVWFLFLPSVYLFTLSPYCLDANNILLWSQISLYIDVVLKQFIFTSNDSFGYIGPIIKK